MSNKNSVFVATLVWICVIFSTDMFNVEALHMEQTKMDWENARAACGQTGHILVPGRRHKASALLKLIPEGSAVWIYGWRSVIDSEQDSRGRVRSLKVDYSRPLKKPQPVVCQEDSTFSVSTRKVLVDLAERQCWSENLEWADVRTNADYSSVMDVMGTSPHWVRSIEPSALGKQCMLARRIGTDLKYDYVACNEQHMHICLTDDDQIASFSPLVVLKMANYDEVEALILSELQPTPPPSSSVPAAVTSSLPAAVTSSLPAAVTSSLQVAVTSSLPAAGMSSVPENVTSSVPPAVTSSTVILEPSSSVTMHEKTSSTPPLAVPTTAASVKDTSSAASTMETSTSVFKSETASKSSVVQSVSDVRKTSESQLTTEVRPTTDSQSTRIGQSTSDVRRTSESQLTTEVHSITDSQSTRIGQSTSDVQSTPVAPSRSQSASEAQSTTETQSTDVAQSIPMATASLSEDSSSILLATISTKDGDTVSSTLSVSSSIEHLPPLLSSSHTPSSFFITSNIIDSPLLQLEPSSTETPFLKSSKPSTASSATPSSVSSNVEESSTLLLQPSSSEIFTPASSSLSSTPHTSDANSSLDSEPITDENYSSTSDSKSSLNIIQMKTSSLPSLSDPSSEYSSSHSLFFEDDWIDLNTVVATAIVDKSSTQPVINTAITSSSDIRTFESNADAIIKPTSTADAIVPPSTIAIQPDFPLSSYASSSSVTQSLAASVSAYSHSFSSSSNINSVTVSPTASSIIEPNSASSKTSDYIEIIEDDQFNTIIISPSSNNLGESSEIIELSESISKSNSVTIAATNTYIVSSAISPTSTRDYTAMSTTSAAVDWQKVYDEMVSFGLNNDTSTTVPDVANTTSGDLTTEIYGNKMDNTTSTDDSANITQTNELPEEHATTTTSYFIESQNDTIESTTYRTLVNDTPISTTDNIANSSDTTTKAYNRDITSFVPTSSSTTMSVSITESTSEPVTSTTSSTTSITTHIDPNSSTEDYYDFYEDYIYKGMYSTTAANEKDSEDSKDVTLATGNAEDDDKDGDSRDEEDYETNETNDAVSKQKTGSDGDEGLETSLWVAFIILAVAVIFCLILAAFLYRRRKKQKSKDITPAENGTAAAEPAVATESDEVELRDSRSPSNTRESATFRDTAYDL